MIKVVEQLSAKERIWVSKFRPVLNGLTLSWPAWTLWVHGEAYQIPADKVTLTAGTDQQSIWLWLSPHAEDGYLHLDVVPEDGVHEPVTPEPFSTQGRVLLLWGTLGAGAAEPELQVLRHVEVLA